MSESPATALDPALHEALQALEAARVAGAPRVDPAAHARLQALAQRLPAQPEAVRARLLPAFARDVDALAQRCAQAQAQLDTLARRLLGARPQQARQLRRLQALGDLRGLREAETALQAEAARAPLAALVAHARSARAAQAPASPLEAGAAHGDELASVQRFRAAWERQRSRTRVAEAAARRPANAGPLNSHVLVLELLEQIERSAPELLRRVVGQLETLQWLDGLREAQEAGKGKRKAR